MKRTMTDKDGVTMPDQDYTPKDHEIRARSIAGAAHVIARREGVDFATAEEIGGDEFDRWAAAHDDVLIETLAEELDRASYDDIPHGSQVRFYYEAWLRSRARQLRADHTKEKNDD